MVENITKKERKETEDDTQENLTAESAIQDIDDFRIQRNFALYKPKAWEEVTKEDIKSELTKIKDNMKILAGLL